MQKNIKILILSQYFYPDVASTGQLLTELAEGLSKAGVEVTVLTAFPSYGGKLAAPKKEMLGSISIRRLWLTRFDKNSKFGQISNSISFFINIISHLIFSSSKVPLLIVSNPPFLPFIGALLKTFRGRKFIYLIHDVFPEKAIKLNYLKANSIMAKIWLKIDKYIFKKVSDIIVLSTSMEKVIKRKLENYKIPLKKISIIHNWADGLFIKPAVFSDNPFVKENSLQNKFVVQYSGNLGASYELEFIIEAAKLIKNDKVVFMFIGNGVKKQKLINEAKLNKLKNVMFLPYQKKDNLPYSLTASGVSIVTYDRNLDGLLMPSKLYSLLAAGTPVAAFCAEDSEVGSIINEAKCGFLIKDNYAENFVEKILYLMENPETADEMGKNARKYFEKNFTFEHSLEQYIQSINSVQD